jgi:hypothetical protein
MACSVNKRLVFVKKKMDKGYVMLKFDDKVTQGSRLGAREFRVRVVCGKDQSNPPRIHQ